MKLCGCDKPCGCGDNVALQAPFCSGYPSCDNPETCSETFDGQCIIYTGETITNIDVPKGARVNEIIQRLVGVISNPGCNYPDSPCRSVIVSFSKITSTTIKLNWAGSQSQVYVVQFRLPTTTTWTSNQSVAVTSDTIGGLTPDTTYYVRVASTCAGSPSCYSLTFEIKTKAS